ncbi:Mus7/MMS22 family-domain-containing protein [Chiua virens]|nr:Mus7/MMS22 family-domain-containing protein [Chiua virens]
MESPDIVDTSDIDEREDLVLSEVADHCATSTSTPVQTVRADVLASPHSVTKGKDHQRHPSPLLTWVTCHGRLSDHESETPSPRKRIKIAHDAGPATPGSTCPTTTEKAFMTINSPVVVHTMQMPSSTPGHSLERVITSEAEQPPASFSPRDVSPHSDWHSLFSSPGASQVPSQNMVLSSTSQHYPRFPSRSVSISNDDLPLVSSPLIHPTTPPQTSQQPDHQYSLEKRKMHSPLSSPLTPSSFPALEARSSSRSPDPLLLLSPRRLHPLTPQSLASRAGSPVVISHSQSPPIEIPEDPQPLARYSLRRREPRQLNPYAYDKLLYKQQLKSHPDAIVKFRSPQRHHEPGGVGEDGTQNEFIFPLDNTKEDDDYVEMGSEGSNRRRRRAQGFDQSGGLGEGDQDARQTDEGWLPETLKALSSSDEDVNRTVKLARKARREREIQEARERKKTSKDAAEAHTAKKRLKPFPIHEDADDEAAAVLEDVHAVAPSPSLLRFTRAFSEPLIASPSPSAVPSRASSHSPAPDPIFPRSPNFNIYLEQEDWYPTDDLAPPSPFAAPTTSSDSILPSNTSGIESDSDRSSTVEMDSKDRKRLRVLKRMVPGVLVNRELRAVPPQPVRAKVAAESSGSEAEEVKLIPGIARVRKGRYKDVKKIRDVDAEEDTGLGTMEIFPEQSDVKVRRARYLSSRFKYEDEVISLSDSSIPGSFSEDSDSGSGEAEEVHQSIYDPPLRGPARERSLIDWMLSRSGGSGRPKSRTKQPSGSRKSRGFGAPRLDIVTSGAKHSEDYHQTRLPFVRVNTNSSVNSSARHDSRYRDRKAQPDRDKVEDDKNRKKKSKRRSKANQGLLYNVHHGTTRITSKHKSSRGGSALVFDNDDNDFRQALDPGWKAEVERWNKPVSRVSSVTTATSAPAAPRPRVYRRSSLQPQNEIPLPLYFQPKEESGISIHRRVVIDMDIIPLLSGVRFGASSYIGKGLLHQLISIVSGNLEVAPPMTCTSQGFEIGPTTSAAVFGALFGPLCDRLTSTLHDFKNGDVETPKEWETVSRAANQLLSWLAVHAEDQEFFALEVTLRAYLDGLLVVLKSLERSTISLFADWFIVELSSRLSTGMKYRRRSVENEHLTHSVKQLMQHLLDIDLRPVFATFRTAEGAIDDTSLPHRAGELWVCLMHLLPCFETPEATPSHPLWRFLGDLHSESSPTGPDASEDMWLTIFSLCTMSQFSVHGLSTSTFRLPAAWDLVAAALKKIILIANPEKDRRLLASTLKMRDEYLFCVVSRCFLLWCRWGWRLDDGTVMFKSLQEIFRSRNFANLLTERSVPMGFLENGDLELLSKRDPHDSVFEVFLKMVVQAVSQSHTNPDLKQRSAHIKKLLQIAVPVSPVPFSRSAPPTAHSLSMLVNRFSAMAVAVHLDPTPPNVKFRVSQARRCVSFKDADDRSRMACIYGMMNFAMIVRHHKVVGGLEEVLGWLRGMADVLMDEYKEEGGGGVGKKAATTLIQLLIGSVRRVVETQSLDRGQDRAEYPDPALLDGPWVTRVFNPRTDLVTIQQTGVEIRMLIQSFLDARAKALPIFQPPPLPVTRSVESQESQDEFDKLNLPIDDELLAALGGEAETLAIAGLKLKEEALCRVLDKFITPAVYRLVCKYFSESEHAKADLASAKAADEWIDCWVGCANVLVYNNCKDWGLYMKLGQQSWEKIIDDSWRRRVGLRFDLTLLRLDPGAYNKMKDEFIAVLLMATLSPKTTIEHEFMSVVLSLDGLQHPLLHTAPFDPLPETRKYEIGQADYEIARERLIETVFANTAACLRAKSDAESQGYAELVVMMLSTMRDIYQGAGEGKEGYGEFCGRVAGMLRSHPELVSHARVSGAYLQQTAQFNPYQQQRLAGSGLSGYSESPSLGLQPHQQHIIGIHEENKIYALVIDLMDPNTREGALLELSKKREQYDDLALVLWHSFGIMPALLQEIVSVYPLLSPPNLTAHVSNRVCNALALLQCVASHSETRQLFLNAHIPLFLYPFLNTTSKTRPFEYLRLTSLGVIGALGQDPAK